MILMAMDIMVVVEAVSEAQEAMDLKEAVPLDLRSDLHFDLNLGDANLRQIF